MFDLDRFIADCRAAAVADRSRKSVREIVARAACDGDGILKGLGKPRRAGIQKRHHAADLKAFSMIWAPCITIMPHDPGCAP
ncbi:MAG TPA: hypothetical protein VF342_12585 [Alphaproteobacteria bacterium]